jgi:hypothetical protein
VQAGRLDTRQVVVPQESRHRLQAIWPIPFFRLSSSRIDGRYSRMLNGLALRDGFEAAPKVRKNRFECSVTEAPLPVFTINELGSK